MSRRNGKGNGQGNGTVSQFPLAVAGATWVNGPELERIADELIASEDITLGGLRSFSLAYELRRGGKAKDEVDIDKVSGAQVTPAAWLHRVGVDGRIWAYEWWWERLSIEHRGAVVLHQLLHFDLSAGRLRRDPSHTAADFDVVVHRFGAWTEGLQLIHKQLTWFDAQVKA